LIICITSPGRGIIRNGFGTTISMDRQIPTGRAGGMARGRSRDLQHPMFGRQTLTAGRTAWGWPRQLIVGAAQYIPRQLANPQGYDGPGEARRANTRERFFSRPPLPWHRSSVWSRRSAPCLDKLTPSRRARSAKPSRVQQLEQPRASAWRHGTRNFAPSPCRFAGSWWIPSIPPRGSDNQLRAVIRSWSSRWQKLARRAGLADQHGCDGAGESQYQDTSGRDGNHVDWPMMADEIDVPWAAFVPVCVKVHGSTLLVSIGGPAFNRQLPKQFLGQLPIAASPRGPRDSAAYCSWPVSPPTLRVIRGTLIACRELLLFPRSADIADRVRQARKVPTADVAHSNLPLLARR